MKTSLLSVLATQDYTREFWPLQSEVSLHVIWVKLNEILTYIIIKELINQMWDVYNDSES